LELLPNAAWDGLRAELTKTATHVHSILSKDPSQNRELFQTADRLLNFVKSPPPKTASKLPRSHCNLNARITAKLESPQILVYKWIVSLSSSEKEVLIGSLKSITGQLKADSHVFDSHLEVLTISLLTLVHVHFSEENRNDRLCKYIAFCLLTLFDSTPLKDVISQICVHQLLYEMVTHLSNGLNEPNLNQVANKLVTTLIDECTLFSFSGIVAGFGEFENQEQFTQNWIKLTAKCFQACGARICQGEREEDVKESLMILEKFFQKHAYEYLLESPIGRKIISVIRTYSVTVFDKFGEVVNSKEVKKRLAVIPSILQLVVVNKS
jgi:hypothetical protein